MTDKMIKMCQNLFSAEAVHVEAAIMDRSGVDCSLFQFGSVPRYHMPGGSKLYYKNVFKYISAIV